MVCSRPAVEPLRRSRSSRSSRCGGRRAGRSDATRLRSRVLPPMDSAHRLVAEGRGTRARRARPARPVRNGSLSPSYYILSLWSALEAMGRLSSRDAREFSRAISLTWIACRWSCASAARGGPYDAATSLVCIGPRSMIRRDLRAFVLRRRHPPSARVRGGFAVVVAGGGGGSATTTEERGGSEQRPSRARGARAVVALSRVVVALIAIAPAFR